MPVYVGIAGDAYHEITGAAQIVNGTHQIQRIYVGLAGDAYHQVYEYDVTGPSVRAHTTTGQSNADMRFAWSGGALVTDASSGVASVKIQRQYTTYAGSAEGWTDVRTLSQAEWEATSGSFDFTPSTTKRRQWGGTASETVGRYYMGFRVVATDNAGNITTTAEVKALTKPYGTVIINPTDQNTYRAGWIGYSGHNVRTGDSGVVVEEYGCYFYGTALADRCDGYTPGSGRFFAQRYSTWGSSGTWNFEYHNLANDSGGGATLGGTVVGVAISGSDDSAWGTMASDWLAPIAAGTAKGVALNSVTAYRVLYNYGEGGSTSGRVELTFT